MREKEFSVERLKLQARVNAAELQKEEALARASAAEQMLVNTHHTAPMQLLRADERCLRCDIVSG